MNSARSLTGRGDEANGAPSSLARILGHLRASTERDRPDVRPVISAWTRRPEGVGAWDASEWDLEELLGSGPRSLQGVSALERIPAPEPPDASSARSGLVAELWQRAKTPGADGEPDRERADCLWLIVLIDPEFARDCQDELRHTGAGESESYQTITMLLAERDRRFGSARALRIAGAGTGR